MTSKQIQKALLKNEDAKELFVKAKGNTYKIIGFSFLKAHGELIITCSDKYEQEDYLETDFIDNKEFTRYISEFNADTILETDDGVHLGQVMAVIVETSVVCKVVASSVYLKSNL